MLAITDIPLADIKRYVQTQTHCSNSDSGSGSNDNIYEIAKNLIFSGKSQDAPPSIVDWIIAYNLYDVDFQCYNASYIIKSPYINLQDLTMMFSLPYVDRCSIIRILGYMRQLNNDMNVFDLLPDEILKNLVSYLDRKTLLLIYKISKNFNKLWQIHSDDLLHQCLTRIIRFNIQNYTRRQLINLCRFYYTSNINCGYNHSLVLKDNGEVYGFGSNSLKQLKNDNKMSIKTPASIIGFENVTCISTGKLYSSIVDNNIVHIFGKHNKKFELENFNIVRISAGYDHMLMLMDNGQIHTFGSNVYGRSGRSESNHKLIDIVQISAGKNYSLVLNYQGNVYAFGNNEYGQLGLDGNFDRYQPELITCLIHIVQISAGRRHSLALTDDGKVFGFGSNRHGQLGLPISDEYKQLNLPDHTKYQPTLIRSGIVQVSAGYDHSLILTNDGQVYAFGNNEYGQLGVKGFIEISLLNICNISQISAGYKCSLALTDHGQVYGFGLNNCGQLGLHDYINRYIPTTIMSIY